MTSEPGTRREHDRTATNGTIRVVAMVGSSRQGSYNRALLQAARESAPASVAIELIEMGDLPFFDADLEARGDPVPVRRLKTAIAQADALLIVTPEYNRSLPAVLKNALDWASRPPRPSALAGKPVLLLGASAGRSAASHAIQHATDVLANIGAAPFERSLGVPRAGDLIDASGRLADERTLEELRRLLLDFERAVRSGGSLRAAA